MKFLLLANTLNVNMTAKYLRYDDTEQDDVSLGRVKKEIHEEEGVSAATSTNPKLPLLDLAVTRLPPFKQNFSSRFEAIKSPYQ